MILNNKYKKGEKEMDILDFQDELNEINNQLIFLTQVTADIISTYERNEVAVGFILNMESVIDKLNLLSKKLDKLKRRENE